MAYARKLLKRLVEVASALTGSQVAAFALANPGGSLWTARVVDENAIWAIGVGPSAAAAWDDCLDGYLHAPSLAVPVPLRASSPEELDFKLSVLEEGAA